MSNVNGTFDAPIPGQSLTQPVGGSRVEHPPQFIHLEDALNFTWDRMHKPKVLVKMMGLLKSGAPVESLVNTMIFRGISEGKWTVDLGLLMYQTVVWQIEAIAKLKKIKYKTFNDDREHNNSMLEIGNLVDSKNLKDKTFEETQSPTEQIKAEKVNKFKGFF